MLSLLSVSDLKVQFNIKGQGILKAVDGVDLNIQPGEIVGLIGESGCGKTVFSLSLLKLISPPGAIVNGTITWQGKDLLKFNKQEIRQVRGREIAMIFQNPQTSLNPIYTIGEQMIAVIRLHRQISKLEAKGEVVRLMRLVNIPDPEKRLNDYPHQFSLGMCQRIMIAMAISCNPKLLIADEPTASLDVTTQAQIIDLLHNINEQFGMAILLVSHELSYMAKFCHRIAVMYLGRIVEVASAKKLLESPKHPYTNALVNCIHIDRTKTVKIKGEIPSPYNVPSGCRFRTRCPEAKDLCSQKEPILQGERDHLTACLLYEQQFTKEENLNLVGG